MIQEAPTCTHTNTSASGLQATVGGGAGHANRLHKGPRRKGTHGVEISPSHHPLRPALWLRAELWHPFLIHSNVWSLFIDGVLVIYWVPTLSWPHLPLLMPWSCLLLDLQSPYLCSLLLAQRLRPCPHTPPSFGTNFSVLSSPIPHL